MVTKITDLNNVKAFALHLSKVENLSFHPDDDFEDYVDFSTNLPSYSKEEASLRNRLMADCFNVCEKEGVEIYEIMFDIISKEMKIGEYYEMA